MATRWAVVASHSIQPSDHVLDLVAQHAERVIAQYPIASNSRASE
jgi:hypothetical protein